MAEDDQSQPTDEAVQSGGDSDAESTGSAEATAAGVDSEGAEKATDDAPTPGEETHVAPTIGSDAANGLYGLGELTLHFPSRDVVVIVDGLAAAMALDAFRASAAFERAHLPCGPVLDAQLVLYLRAARGTGRVVVARDRSAARAPDHRPRGARARLKCSTVRALARRV